MDSYSHAVSQTQEVSPDKPVPKQVTPKPKKAWMSWKKVAIVKESPTIVTTCTKVTQELAGGSVCIITTTSPPYAAPIKAKETTTKKVATPVRPRSVKKHQANPNDDSDTPASKKPSADSDRDTSTPDSKKPTTDSDHDSSPPDSDKPSAESDNELPVATFKYLPATTNKKKDGTFGDKPVTFTPD